MRIAVDWDSFYLANAIVVVLGICVAMVGWRAAWLALTLPALMLINATFFHIFQTIITRVYSPGLATAVALFYPVGAWAYYGAWLDGALSAQVVIVSGVLGALLMATPIVLLRVKTWKMFAYRDGATEADASPDSVP